MRIKIPKADVATAATSTASCVSENERRHMSVESSLPPPNRIFDPAACEEDRVETLRLISSLAGKPLDVFVVSSRTASAEPINDNDDVVEQACSKNKNLNRVPWQRLAVDGIAGDSVGHVLVSGGRGKNSRKFDLLQHRWKLGHIVSIQPRPPRVEQAKAEDLCSRDNKRQRKLNVKPALMSLSVRVWYFGPSATLDYTGTERDFLKARQIALQASPPPSQEPPLHERNLLKQLQLEEAALIKEQEAEFAGDPGTVARASAQQLVASEAALEEEFSDQILAARRKLRDAEVEYSKEEVEVLNRQPPGRTSAVQVEQISLRQDDDVREGPQIGPTSIDPSRCMARTWNNGRGGQCTRLRGHNEFCKFHLRAASQTHGRVDGPVPAKKLEEFLAAGAMVTMPSRATEVSISERLRSSRVQARDVERQLRKLQADMVGPSKKELARLETEYQKRLSSLRRAMTVSQKELQNVRKASISKLRERITAIQAAWEHASKMASERWSQDVQEQLEREVNELREQLCASQNLSCLDVFAGKRGVICLGCNQALGLPCREMRCDLCFAEWLRQQRMAELNLRPHWCKEKNFTAYSVFMHERVISLRVERKADIAVLRDIAKREWNAMNSAERGLWEKKRESIMEELYSNLQTVPNKDLACISDAMPVEEAVGDVVDVNAMASNTMTCWQCFGNDGEMLSCGNRVDSDNESQRSSCQVTIHLRCLKSALQIPTSGMWFCSELCRRIQSSAQASDDVSSTSALATSSAVQQSALSTTDVRWEAKAALSSARRSRFLLDRWEVVSPLLHQPDSRRVALEKHITKHSTRAGVADAHEVDVTSQLSVASTIQGLRPYQEAGVRWMAMQHDQVGSGILGDEMGLGKTLQVLAFMSLLSACSKSYVMFLVICPLSVMATWRDESRRWTPRTVFLELHGTEQERSRQKVRFQGAWANRDDAPLLLVTTYEVVLAELAWLRRLTCSYLILDEAQRIKNEQSQLGQAVRGLRAERRLLLTGTPLQNNLRELWSLLNFLFPEAFDESCRKIFENAFSASSGQADKQTLSYCHALLQPLMLRRLKADVLGDLLPSKHELILNAPLSPVQRWHYRELLRQEQAGRKPQSLLPAPSDLPEGSVKYRNLTNLLLQLCKCCNHPYFFDGVRKAEADDANLIFSSGKLSLLDHLLQKLFSDKTAGPQKILIFSQYTSMLDLLEEYVSLRAYGYVRLDGSTSISRRRYYMHLFNHDPRGPPLFLISTRAGGLGLNLQAASVVILYDSSWNPWVDLQAMDRVHRVGQTKEVKVFRLICNGTCEERIRFFSEQKLQLKTLVLEDADQANRLEGHEDISLFAGAQLAEMLRFGAETFLQESAAEESTEGAAQIFHREVGKSLAEQLESLKTASELATAPKIRREVGSLSSEKQLPSHLEASASSDIHAASSGSLKRHHGAPLNNMLDDGSRPKRSRKSTVVIVDSGDPGLGKVAVSRWSLEQEQREAKMLERQQEEREMRKLSKNVLEHESTCLHCKGSIHSQTVVVEQVHSPADGRCRERWTLQHDREGKGARSVELCAICPRAFHTRCRALYGPGRNCPQHRCTACGRSPADAGGLLFRCVDCPRALCYDCLESLNLLHAFVRLSSSPKFDALGFAPPACYEYMRCPDCHTAGTV